MSVVLPKNAQAVIIGGGVVGCSVAYHLAKLGYTDIVLFVLIGVIGYSIDILMRIAENYLVPWKGK